MQRTRTASTAAVPLLLYHALDVPDDPWSVSAARFGRDLDSLAESGRSVLTVENYVSRLRAGAGLEGLASITFDDGHASTLLAVRLLHERGLPSTVYVTTELLGQQDMLDLPSLLELASVPGVEIGSHSAHHLRLDELRRPDIDRELRDSRARLEDLLQRPVTGVAYPHGCHDHRVTDAALAAGYTSGAGVKNALSHRRDNPMAVARLTMTSEDSELQVRTWLAAEGRLGERRPRARTRAHRMVRRTRALLGG